MSTGDLVRHPRRGAERVRRVERHRAASVAVESLPDGTAEVVGSDFYCLMMYERATRRPRPTLEAMLDALLLDAMAVDLHCRVCGRLTRHSPTPGEETGHRCSACSSTRGPVASRKRHQANPAQLTIRWGER